MKPILLHYYLTNRCNSRCGFCSIWQETPKIDASDEDVLINLEEGKKAGCRFVDFTGGEPLLHKSLPLFLRKAKSLGFFTSVTTNCILFPDSAPALKGLVDLLHFSLDADKAELHDHIRGVASFKSVMESIEISREMNLSADLLFTYTNENISAFEGAYKLAQRNKMMIILDPVFDIRGRDPVNSQVHSKALQFSKLKGVYLNRAHISLRAQGGNHIRAPLCRAVESTIVIMPNNTMALPCFHHRIMNIPAGKNMTSALKSSQRAEALEKQGKYSFCEGCHINCYFDPSFVLMRNRLFLQSILSKASYTWNKYFLLKKPLPLPSLRKR
ncbi:MAG: radical SAM protein [Fibrobacter sp.]|nr:radical SAM protein [Fibrobacter sp.]